MANNKQLNFTGQTIYVGIDVHKRSWTVSIHAEDFEYKTFTQPPNPKVLVKYLGRTFAGATYHAAYEAGYAGFWIHDQLCAMGVNCAVVHAADVPVTDKDKRRKQDPRDSRRIARGLRSGELESIYVPSVQAREDRGLVRRRNSLVRDKTRIKNRIKSMLQLHGIQIPDHFKGRCWSRAFITWLDALTLSSDTGNHTLNSLLRQLAYHRNEEAIINGEIRTLARSKSYRRKVKYLSSIPGIGITSAMVWLTELIDIGRFETFDQLVSYVGLVPYERSSGERQHTYGLDKRGNHILKTLLIENSWIALRRDPGLICAYQNLKKRMTGNRAVIRIARKLLRRIRYVLINETTYEYGLA